MKSQESLNAMRRKNQEEYEEWEEEALPDPEVDEEALFAPYENEEKSERLHTAQSAGHFFSIVIGTALCLVLAALLISLLTWLRQDVGDTFSILLSHLS